MTIHVFGVKESIPDISTELPCLGDLENPGRLPVQHVLGGTGDCVLSNFEISSLFMFLRSGNPLLTFLLSYHVRATSKIQVTFPFKRFFEVTQTFVLRQKCSKFICNRAKRCVMVTRPMLYCQLYCHVTSCHVMSRQATSFHIMSRHVTSCHVMPHHVTSCHVMYTSFHVLSRPVASCHVPCHVLSRHVTSCHVMSRHVTPCHIMSRYNNNNNNNTQLITGHMSVRNIK